MLKTLAAAAALSLLAGAGFAQSSTTSSSTTVTTPSLAPTHDVDLTSTTRRTEGKKGVLIEKDESGTEISSPGTPATTRTESETTTVR